MLDEIIVSYDSKQAKVLSIAPATGSTITAAIDDASCSAIILSSSSARCPPQLGSPLEKAISFRLCVWGKWSTKGSEAPEKAFLFGPMPPTLIPNTVQCA